MYNKAAVWGSAALMLATVGVAGCSDNRPGESVDGPALHIDVVAPKEPELAQTSGKLSVGELTDAYDHTETLQRAAPAEDPNDYTAWDDGAWVAETGTGDPRDDKRIYRSDEDYDDRKPRHDKRREREADRYDHYEEQS
jgi:hypothetical protein